VKNVKQNVIVVNMNGNNSFCRAARKKTVAKATNITTLCGSIVPGITEVYLPGVAIVTCVRCRALESGVRTPGHYGVEHSTRRR